MRWFVGLAGSTEQVDEGPQLRAAEVAELPGMAGADFVLQLFEQSEAGSGDTHLDHSAVVGHAAAGDEAALVELVEQPSDIGGPRDEPAGEGQGGQRGGMLGAEESEGVVLLGGEVEAGEQVVFDGAEAVVGPPEVEEGGLLGGVESGGGGSLGG